MWHSLSPSSLQLSAEVEAANTEYGWAREAGKRGDGDRQIEVGRIMSRSEFPAE